MPDLPLSPPPAPEETIASELACRCGGRGFYVLPSRGGISCTNCGFIYKLYPFEANLCGKTVAIGAAPYEKARDGKPLVVPKLDDEAA